MTKRTQEFRANKKEVEEMNKKLKELGYTGLGSEELSLEETARLTGKTIEKVKRLDEEVNFSQYGKIGNHEDSSCEMLEYEQITAEDIEKAYHQGLLFLGEGA